MNNNSKTLNISTKKAWIIGTVLSLVASIFPTWFLAKVFQEIILNILKETIPGSFFRSYKFFFPIVFIIFFLFFAIFILICKWQGNKK